jgi:hypothetical protein
MGKCGSLLVPCDSLPGGVGSPALVAIAPIAHVSPRKEPAFVRVPAVSKDPTVHQYHNHHAATLLRKPPVDPRAAVLQVPPIKTLPAIERRRCGHSVLF